MMADAWLQRIEYILWESQYHQYDNDNGYDFIRTHLAGVTAEDIAFLLTCSDRRRREAGKKLQRAFE